MAREMFGPTKTALPMNVHKRIWGTLIAKEPEDLYDLNTNIETGTVLIKRIRDRLEKPTPQKIGTLYNNLYEKNINKYGQYVGEVYQSKPWQELPKGEFRLFQ